MQKMKNVEEAEVMPFGFWELAAQPDGKLSCRSGLDSGWRGTFLSALTL